MLKTLFRGVSQKKVAVVLSGAGAYDGSEITETVALFVHLSKHAVLYQCYAPAKPQTHVINHLTGQPSEGQERNVLEEAARLPRGAITALSELSPSHYDGLLMPGGFGAAKNLSSFVVKGKDMTVDSVLLEVIEEFYREKKPIGACCIAPIILAKVLGTSSGHSGVELTLGKRRTSEHWPFSMSIEVADGFGNSLIEKDVDDLHVDQVARIVTTPAYMKATALPCEVFEGIGKMVTEFIKLL